MKQIALLTKEEAKKIMEAQNLNDIVCHYVDCSSMDSCKYCSFNWFNSIKAIQNEIKAGRIQIEKGEEE